ncbi:MAG: adenylyltransferase [Candidatus Schekmanbacteria bacterium GWA2_38_9]|uniref:Adenylyltransferase n=1 Tax=Candidatus Schekmanbacteria bacterium RIFCSPLOWO2_12_FULL_38_15 TaxID=1817883 RepID=A0A1F7SFV8_9BACT|nr:MAG: adenylyltransferase [Candidatus Schekmanbacteria bacterium GWA2_38_9]OGL52645.1 MAG: adenylyltransferase [Candidatus Schekmanbacteria bacterium RIFCSPLOWO2_12_FULL_38_15]
MDFSEEQIERYSRQIILPEIGGKGQKKLLNSKVLIIGAGGLGSPSSMYLAAAGVGKIGIADSDVVDLSNLQRQILHKTENINRKKVDSALDTLKGINPDIEVVPLNIRIDSKNIIDIIDEYDVVVDGSDNFPTKFLINDACVMKKKPLSIAGILRFMGQILTVVPGKSACYRCVFEKPPEPGSIPSCREAGVIGAVGGLVGMIQATEVIKMLLGIGKLIDGIMIVETIGMTLRKIKIHPNKSCPVCGENPTITALEDYELVCERRED